MIQLDVFEDMMLYPSGGQEPRVTSQVVTYPNIAGYLLKLQMTKVTNLACA